MNAELKQAKSIRKWLVVDIIYPGTSNPNLSALRMYGHTYSKSIWINSVRLPTLLVVSFLGVWSRETGSAVRSRVSLLISILRLNLVLTYGIPPEFRGGVHLCI